MQLQRILILLLMMLLVVGVAACGNSQPEPEPEPTLEPTAVSPTTIPSINTPTHTATVAIVATLEATAVPPTTTNPPPTHTPSPADTTIPPTETAVPLNVNGIPATEFLVLPPEVRQNVRAIFAQGQDQERSATTFSKLGDSTSLNPNFLGRFDDPTSFNLGEFDYLQPTIDHFSGHFARYGVAAKNGLHSWSVFDPLWADKEWCEPNEDVLNCEFRLNNPSIIFVRLGSNDAGAPSGYRFNMKQVVETSLANGVIPILVTKADRFEGGDNVNNNILRELAAEFNVPLLEFDLVAETLPNRGLLPNDVHMAELVGPHDFTLPETMQSGHAVHDLIALMMLDELRRETGQ